MSSKSCISLVPLPSYNRQPGRAGEPIGLVFAFTGHDSLTVLYTVFYGDVVVQRVLNKLDELFESYNKTIRGNAPIGRVGLAMHHISSSSLELEFTFPVQIPAVALFSQHLPFRKMLHEAVSIVAGDDNQLSSIDDPAWLMQFVSRAVSN